MDELVIFSKAYSKHIAKGQHISDSYFQALLDKAGGRCGHAKLFVIPVQQLKQESLNADNSCVDPLSEANFIG